MRPWKDRPPEIASLLNPAFCAEVCRRVVHAHAGRHRGPFPPPLLYLILPLLLHRKTREEIGERSRQKMHAWLLEHSDLRVGFADRVRRSAPSTLEALSFLVCTGAAHLDPSGLILRGYAPTSVSGRHDDVAEIYKKSAVVGRWFADAGETESVYTMWGIRP